MSFLHRDVKPDNIRVRADGSIVLIDFGISGELIKNGLHISNSVGKGLRGTPHFASIYSHRSEELSRRDDVLSLLFTLLYLVNNNSLPWISDNDYRDNLKFRHD